MRAARLEDVAAAAGVSPATVSRVINGRPVVAPETRERVLAAVQRLNFRPDSLARSLATRRTGALGLVIADITNPFYPEVVRGVEQTAAGYDLSVLLYDTAEDSEREAQSIRLLGERRVDGVIVCAARLPEARLAKLVRPDTPIVLINRRLSHLPVCTVEVDQETGVREALLHLAALGHRRIAFIGGPVASQVQQRRLAAFRRECRNLGIFTPGRWIVDAPPTIIGGKEAASALFARDARPGAILAYNDLIAIGAAIAAQEAGIAIPAELSIIGHDDIPLAGVVHPALTTVRQPMRDLGVQAVLLLQQCFNGGAPARTPPLIQLAPRLIVRASTAPAQAGSE